MNAWEIDQEIRRLRALDKERKIEFAFDPDRLSARTSDVKRIDPQTGEVIEVIQFQSHLDEILGGWKNRRGLV